MYHHFKSSLVAVVELVDTPHCECGPREFESRQPPKSYVEKDVSFLKISNIYKVLNDSKN